MKPQNIKCSCIKPYCFLMFTKYRISLPSSVLLCNFYSISYQNANKVKIDKRNQKRRCPNSKINTDDFLYKKKVSQAISDVFPQPSFKARGHDQDATVYLWEEVTSHIETKQQL